MSQVLWIHKQSVDKYGGAHGIRDVGLMVSAVERPKSSFEDQDLYESVFDKAASLLQSLLKNHPFIDGNKRTALAAAGIFLKINGFKLKNTELEEVEFAVKVDKENLSEKKISEWLKENATPSSRVSSSPRRRGSNKKS